MDRVVLVHGLWMRDFCFIPMAKRLRAAGFVVDFFNYPTTAGALSDHARSLNDYLRSKPTGFVIAHSLGCLVTLAAMRRAQVQRAVLLGPPLRGSFIAHRIRRMGLGRLMFGRVGDDLARGYPKGLSDRIGVIAGTRRVGLGAALGGGSRPSDGTVAVDETMLPDLTHHITLPVTHSSMLFSRVVMEQAVTFLRRGSFAPPSDKLIR